MSVKNLGFKDGFVWRTNEGPVECDRGAWVPCRMCGRYEFAENPLERRVCMECVNRGHEPELVDMPEPDEHFVMGVDRSEDSKPTNPKDLLGVKRAGIHTVPAAVFFEVGLAMLEGALKYTAHNYREAGVLSSVYYNAAVGHIAQWWEGEDLDPDSGLNHLIKAMACLVILLDGVRQGNLKDDRPKIGTPAGWKKELNAKAAALIERYGNRDGSE